MDPVELERLIDRELRRLPPPRAPRTLLPRVMAAAGKLAARPWYSRAWLTWPIGWQMASVAALCAVAAGVAMMLPSVRTAASALSFMADLTGGVSDRTRDVEGAATAVRVLWRTLLAPVVPYAFGLVLIMSAACAVLGTVLNHLVFGKAWR